MSFTPLRTILYFSLQPQLLDAVGKAKGKRVCEEQSASHRLLRHTEITYPLFCLGIGYIADPHLVVTHLHFRV